MNIRKFLIGLFTGGNVRDDLDQVRAAAAQDADLLVDTYVGAFQEQVNTRFEGAQQRFLGHADVDDELLDPDDVIDAEFVETYEGWTVAELLKECRANGFNPSVRRKKDLIKLLRSGRPG